MYCQNEAENLKTFELFGFLTFMHLMKVITETRPCAINYIRCIYVFISLISSSFFAILSRQELYNLQISGI